MPNEPQQTPPKQPTSSKVQNGTDKWFARLLKRPVTVFMLVLAMVGTSMIAASRIPIEMMPQGFASSNIVVMVPWAGANPAEIETRVVRPLEEELRTLTGVTTVHAVAAEGSGRLVLVFPGTTDMDQAYAEVADRVERVRPNLPREADRISIRRWTTADTPIMWCGVLYPPEEHDEAQDLFADVLQPRIEAVEGVARANLNGLEPKSIRIWLDEELVQANRVDLGGLIRRLQSDNVSAPVGDLDDAGSRYIVRVDSRFKSTTEIENFPVRPGLRIKDVGRVVAVRSAPEFLFRVNGQYGLGIAINKETSANTFEVCSALTHLFENELPDDPVLGKFDYAVFWNEGETIESSLRNLVQDAAIGGLIACVVLLLFLRRLRFTLLIALTIPFSVLITLTWLYFTGKSFNLFSMMGITISIGMLVDNSVVIVESIFHRRERGDDLKNACVRGPSEMVLAVLTATLTSVVVFLPLIFMSEDRNARVFTTSIGIPLCIALLAALVLAIIVVPVASRYLVSPKAPTQSSRIRVPGLAAFDRRMGRIKEWLPKLMEWSLRHRFIASTLAILFLLSGQVAQAGAKFNPNEMTGFGGETDIDFDFSANTTLLQAEAEVLRMEEILGGPLKEKLGNPDYGIGFNREDGEINLWYEKDLSQEESQRVQDLLKEHLPKSAAVEYRFDGGFQQQNDQDEKWLRIQVQGPESSIVQRIAATTRELARSMDAFETVADDQTAAREMLVSLDREGLQRMNTSSQQVLGMIEWALRGFMVSRMETNRGDVPIIIEFDQETKPNRLDLQELSVAWFDNGAQLPLSNFASFDHRRTPDSIYRRDGKTMSVVGLKPKEKEMRKNAVHLESLMSQVRLPEGYEWSQGGGWNEFQNDMSELRSAAGLSIGLVFFLMGLLFESLILPVSVLITIWFAYVGSQWAFRITDTPVDLIGMIGMIVLIGVVVNNGIVLVDHILRLRAQGLPRTKAVVQAVRDRLRPVLMTALTTITGLMPIALSQAEGNGFSFKSLAIGVSGGLAFTTFFTLWMVPLLYTLLDDFGKIFRNRILQPLIGQVRNS